MARVPIRVNDDVEVLQHEHGFKGGWCPATVQALNAEGSRALIQYKHFENSDGYKLHAWKEIISSRLVHVGEGEGARYEMLYFAVRPVPPRVYHPPGGWAAGTIVDARWNDMWWKGTIVGNAGRNGLVFVAFDEPPEGEGGRASIQVGDTRKSLVFEPEQLGERRNPSRGGIWRSIQ